MRTLRPTSHQRHRGGQNTPLPTCAQCSVVVVVTEGPNCNHVSNAGQAHRKGLDTQGPRAHSRSSVSQTPAGPQRRSRICAPSTCAQPTSSAHRQALCCSHRHQQEHFDFTLGCLGEHLPVLQRRGVTVNEWAKNTGVIPLQCHRGPAPKKTTLSMCRQHMHGRTVLFRRCPWLWASMGG